jgi:phage terminase large subunit-like protein
MTAVPKPHFDKFMQSLSSLEAMMLKYEWDLYARLPQRPPQGYWLTWLIMAGRGFGKTRPGSEQVIAWAQELGRDYGGGHIALIAPNPADARSIMIEGESGILTCSPPWFRPLYEPSKKQLRWDNGVIAHIYSAEEPDQLRGPQHHKGWGDEPCKWRYPQETWDMYQFGLRMGDLPQTVLTTTPRPIKMLTEILDDPDTVVTTGTTEDNFANLSPSFIRRVYRKYKGTRLGRQELGAELLTDTPGALWTLDAIEALRVPVAPCEMVIIVVGVDPGVTDPKDDPELIDSVAETGIVIVGKGADTHGYVMHDFSAPCSPAEWGKRACVHYETLKAERIVGEVNNGGDMVEFVVKTAARDLGYDVNFKKVHASRGKRTRAEPVAAVYEQKRFHHIGMFAELEDQMTTWVPGMRSPDRMDALVWAATEAVLMSPDELVYG